MTLKLFKFMLCPPLENAVNLDVSKFNDSTVKKEDVQFQNFLLIYIINANICIDYN